MQSFLDIVLHRAPSALATTTFFLGDLSAVLHTCASAGRQGVSSSAFVHPDRDCKPNYIAHKHGRLYKPGNNACFSEDVHIYKICKHALNRGSMGCGIAECKYAIEVAAKFITGWRTVDLIASPRMAAIGQRVCA
eukprot:351455-Chlamydomonas_euryale.AAC.1